MALSHSLSFLVSVENQRMNPVATRKQSWVGGRRFGPVPKAEVTFELPGTLKGIKEEEERVLGTKHIPF